MAYLGTPPQSGFITTAKQRVTSSTNNYVDLDHSISSIADVIVFVNFVKQDTTNLTLTTSTRITLGDTLVSSDVVEIHYLGKAVNTQTPSTGTVTNDMLAGSINESKLLGSIPTSKISGSLGKIGQVVEVIHNSNSFTTANSFSDLFQIQITPSATSSKVLIALLGQYNLYGNGASTSGIGHVTITDSSDNQLSTTYLTNVFPSNTGQMDSSVCLFHIATPSSTSQQTFKCRYMASGGGQRMGLMGGSSRENGTRLLALEILA